jgi:hypothetical protein
MSVLDRLANALGRNDERPNVELAAELAQSGDAAAIAELASALTSGTSAVQNDAIKALYEIGALRPELIASHAQKFFALLASRNNRNVWGALQAIESISATTPDAVFGQLAAILSAADAGSVIAKDKAMQILATLAGKGHADTALPLLIARLEHAAVNQLPMYAELAAPVMTDKYKRPFEAALKHRLPGEVTIHPTRPFLACFAVLVFC